MNPRPLATAVCECEICIRNHNPKMSIRKQAVLPFGELRDRILRRQLPQRRGVHVFHHSLPAAAVRNDCIEYFAPQAFFAASIFPTCGIPEVFKINSRNLF
jgi:hypothetical protein